MGALRVPTRWYEVGADAALSLAGELVRLSDLGRHHEKLTSGAHRPHHVRDAPGRRIARRRRGVRQPPPVRGPAHGAGENLEDAEDDVPGASRREVEYDDGMACSNEVGGPQRTGIHVREPAAVRRKSSGRWVHMASQDSRLSARDLDHGEVAEELNHFAFF